MGESRVRSDGADEEDRLKDLYVQRVEEEEEEEQRQALPGKDLSVTVTAHVIVDVQGWGRQVALSSGSSLRGASDAALRDTMLSLVEAATAEAADYEGAAGASVADFQFSPVASTAHSPTPFRLTYTAWFTSAAFDYPEEKSVTLLSDTVLEGLQQAVTADSSIPGLVFVGAARV